MTAIAQAQDSHRFRERFLLILVVLLASIANIPPQILADLGIAREIIIAVLGLLIVLALFLYLRFFFFLLYVLLTIGANLPDQWAQTLGIARAPLLIALILMVTGSSLNYLGNFMPTGLGVRTRTPRRNNADALTALLKAIDKQQLRRMHAILEIDFNLDQPGPAGDTALIHAVRTGNATLVKTLLDHGANPQAPGAGGTAIDCAQTMGNTELVALLSAPRLPPEC